MTASPGVAGALHLSLLVESKDIGSLCKVLGFYSPNMSKDLCWSVEQLSLDDNQE